MDIGIYARDDYYFNYRNADFNALMAKAEATVDENARNALLAEAPKKLPADAVNVFLSQLAKHGLWDRAVVALWEHSPVPATDLTEVSWKSGYIPRHRPIAARKSTRPNSRPS